MAGAFKDNSDLALTRSHVFAGNFADNTSDPRPACSVDAVPDLAPPVPSQGTLPDKSDCVDAPEARLVGCQAKSEMTKDYFFKLQSWNTAGSSSDDVLSVLETKMWSPCRSGHGRQQDGQDILRGSLREWFTKARICTEA